MDQLKMPAIDLPAIRSGDDAALVEALFALAGEWLRVSESHLAFPIRAADVAAAGDSSRAGLLAAAVDLRRLLCAAPKGREALRNLGFERFLQNIECE